MFGMKITASRARELCRKYWASQSREKFVRETMSSISILASMGHESKTIAPEELKFLDEKTIKIFTDLGYNVSMNGYGKISWRI